MKKITTIIICLMFGFGVGFFILAGIEGCKLRARKIERKLREEKMKQEIDKMIDSINYPKPKIKKVKA